MPPPKAKAASKKPPSRARKPTTKAKAAKEASASASEEDLPAAISKRKMPAKSKATQSHKKKALELSDSVDEGQARGDDAGDGEAWA
jgi:hypothetical protein